MPFFYPAFLPRQVIGFTVWTTRNIHFRPRRSER